MFRAIARPIILVSAVFLFASGASRATDALVADPGCDEAQFDTALQTVDGSGGGTITFACATPAIAFTSSSYRSVSHTVVVDGGGTMTLNGAYANAFFKILAGAQLTLTNITLEYGVFHDVHALENLGTLILDNATVKLCTSAYSTIYNEGDLLLLGSSLLVNNLTVAAGDSSGAAIFSTAGSVGIVGGQVYGNSITGAGGSGGALAITGGTLRMNRVTATQNSAATGGAISLGSGVTALIENSTIGQNYASAAGAIDNQGSDLTLRNDYFYYDSTQSGDGAVIRNVTGTLLADGVEFDQNTSAGTGGAISCQSAQLPSVSGMTIRNSTFYLNSAASNGGAIYADCPLEATNDTFDGNQVTGATGEGGAIFQGTHNPAITLAFATVAGNTTVVGAGGGLFGGSIDFSVGSSIVAANAGNCAGTLSSADYNVSDAHDCGGAFTAAHDLLDQTVSMGGIGSYGNLRLDKPNAGNPAIDHVPVGSCSPAIDERRATRPAGTACDAGAFEVDGIVDEIFLDPIEMF